MVEPEKNPGGIAVDREGNAAPTVADVAMTRGQRAVWIALIAAQVLIALAVVLCLICVPGQIRAESQSGMGDMSGERSPTPIAVLRPHVQDPFLTRDQN